MEINGLNGYASYVQTPNSPPASTNDPAGNAPSSTSRQESSTLQRDPTQTATQINISPEGRQAAIDNAQSPDISQNQSRTNANSTLESSTTQQQVPTQPNETITQPDNVSAQQPMQQSLETTLAQNVGFQAYGMAGNFGIPQQNAIDRTL